MKNNSVNFILLIFLIIFLNVNQTRASQDKTTVQGCNVVVTGDRPGIDSHTWDKAYDGDTNTYFTNNYNQWQYVQIDMGCEITLEGLRRYMTTDGTSTNGDRGYNGESISYSLNGSNWNNFTNNNSTGWSHPVYVYGDFEGPAWYQVVYGWSEWNQLKIPVKARYIRFKWEGNGDCLNEIGVDTLEPPLYVYFDEPWTKLVKGVCYTAKHEPPWYYTVRLSKESAQKVKVSYLMEGPDWTSTKSIEFSPGETVKDLKVLSGDPYSEAVIAVKVTLKILNGADIINNSFHQNNFQGDLNECKGPELTILFWPTLDLYSDCAWNAFDIWYRWIVKAEYPQIVGFEDSDSYSDILYSLRDDIMAKSATGRYFIEMYEKYSPELAEIVVKDGLLFWNSIDVIDEWMPAAESLVENKGNTVTITQTMVNNLIEVLKGYKAGAGPELKALMKQELNALDLPSFVGLTVDKVWEKINDRDSLTLSLNRSQLTFGASGTIKTVSQPVLVSKTGTGSFTWSASSDKTWIKYNPSTGTGTGEIMVSVDPAGLSSGTYTGTLSISSPNAINSPKTVAITLNVYHHGASTQPFGNYATPGHGSTVSSSVPFTGWVLDDIGLDSVKLYREANKSLVFIGDAVFVDGARPDVEAAYPDYPMNYQAGWGYMMLTNFLPNGGNGVFSIQAIATDLEGHQVTLGAKTVTVDNANAVKPFGAIDTPSQGGFASGNSYVNWGWVLTPMPNSIPTNGSTINVWVDGVNLGQPVYNIYRQDIANKFPGNVNSDGAIGYFNLDTTSYANGVHTIQWTATDDAGNTDGIGSRYFTIQNTGADARASAAMGHRQWAIGEISKIDVDHTHPIFVQKGFSEKIFKSFVTASGNDEYRIKIRELVPLKIELVEDFSIIACYQLVGNRTQKMPPGMTLNDNTLNWMPGIGYLGNYNLVILVQNKNKLHPLKRINLRITISPKFSIDIL